MKYSAPIPAILLSLTSVNALAEDFSCKPIEGIIQQLTPDPKCTILRHKPKHFPGTTFVGPLPPACFLGSLTATFDNMQVTGTAYSGLTVNGIGEFTAASAIRLSANSFELGWVFTQDTLFGVDDDAEERLIMVSGTRTFKGGHGTLEIPGNALLGDTHFNGVICIEN